MFFTNLTLRSLTLRAMIPLVVLGGTPLAVCRCANGEQTLFCRLVNSFETVSSDAASEECCRGKLHTIAPEGADAGGFAFSSRCCHLVLERPTPGVIAERTEVSHDKFSAFAVPLILAESRLEVERFFRAAFDSHHAAPPPDLVVLHHAFLI